MTRDEMVNEIRRKKLELKRPMSDRHRHDLNKHIHRMEVQVKVYDRYQREARKKAVLQ